VTLRSLLRLSPTMAVPTLLLSLQLALGAVSYESSVKADGSVSRAAHLKRHHHIHRPHVKYHGLPNSWGASSAPSILAEIDQASSDEQEEVNTSSPSSTSKTLPVRQDGKFPVINEWACALMCAGRAEDGCCAYKDNAKRVGDENDGDNYEDDTGLCEFRPGFTSIDVASADEWSSAPCVAGFGTSKCSQWQRGRCGGPAEKEVASAGLPVWELIWEDNFDHLTCVPDRSGIMRPNPQIWTAEVGYKRGKELQWYQPENAECKNGALVITAKRERATQPEPQCTVHSYSPGPTDPVLTEEKCSVCSPPHFRYGDPCDVLSDDSSAPACDCSASAQFTSASLVTRGKKEFSYGMLEMRARIDTRPGAWTSLWSVGDFENVPWPKNGEIDILDAFQGMLKASVVHADESGLPSKAVQHAAAKMTSPDWEERFHTWTMEWDKNFVSVRVDRQEIMKLDLSVADPVRTSWPNPFTSDKPFFLVLSLAVGGHSGGDPSESDFPVKFEVDYIKYFRKKGRTDR